MLISEMTKDSGQQRNSILIAPKGGTLPSTGGVGIIAFIVIGLGSDGSSKSLLATVVCNTFWSLVDRWEWAEGV